MKLLLNLSILALFFSSPSFGEPEKLRVLSEQLGVAAGRLLKGANHVIGNNPRHKQQVAYEPMTSLHNSAHRFEEIVHSGSMSHAQNLLVVSAFQQVKQDTAHAREAFLNLFPIMDDHPALEGLEQRMRNCELLILDIFENLPTALPEKSGRQTEGS